MRSSARAALLAAAMNLVPAAPLDLLRFLRVPAIVWVLRRNGRFCREQHARHRRRGR
jgi:Zn-dependent protease